MEDVLSHQPGGTNRSAIKIGPRPVGQTGTTTKALDPVEIVADIGVIPARFQCHVPHAGHLSIINEVLNKHKKVIIALGVRPMPPDRDDPLDYITREVMLREAFPPERYPGLVVVPIRDCRDDAIWSAHLDTKIREIAPLGNVLLYGSRDSFISHYSGRFPTVELPQDTYYSGTQIRKELSHQVRRSPDFRAGMIYAAFQQHPRGLPTVDLAILDRDKKRILLARKPNEISYRFVGGFYSPQDASFKATALREGREETHLELVRPIYIDDTRVDDWRQAGRADQICTILFAVDYVYGRPEPDDDVAELRWFDWGALALETFVPEHRRLFASLQQCLGKDVPASVPSVVASVVSAQLVKAMRVVRAYQALEPFQNIAYGRQADKDKCDLELREALAAMSECQNTTKESHESNSRPNISPTV